MPRIRKKTTNRLKTNDIKKLQKKVKETKRKSAKAAKNSVQWKSKHKKDPGIPNDFPYKDQILAEVAAERRLAAEEKERRKEEKKIARAKDKNPDAEDEEEALDVEDDAEDAPDPMPKGLNVGGDAIASLSAKLVRANLKKRPVVVEQEEEEDEEEEVPVLINRDLPNLKAVLDAADVVVEVLDAKDPLAFRSEHLEELAAGKRTLLVLNKIDTCPRESVSAWSSHLRTQHPTFIFRSATSFLPTGPEIPVKIKSKGKGKAKVPTNDAIGADAVLACLGKWAGEKAGDQPLTVAVVGIANVGKSAFLNSLLHQAALPVYKLSSSSNGQTTTTLPQEVTLDIAGKQIRIIDTPGLSWIPDESVDNMEEIRARDILLRSRGKIDRLKDPSAAVAHIVSRANTEDLMLLYSLPAFAKGDPTSFLSGVARSNQMVKRKGDLDLPGAARIVLHDWSVGKFMRYSAPPTSASVTTLVDADLYANDEAILENLPTRKEMRKSAGLVKLISGSIETRKTDLEGVWAELKENEDESEDEDGEGFGEGMEVDEDEEEDDEEGEDEGDDDDEEEEEEEEATPPPPPVSNKQKRKRVPETAAAPPRKKVAFSRKLEKPQSVKVSKSTEEETQKPPSALKKAVTKSSAAPQKRKPLVKVSAVAAVKSKVANAGLSKKAAVTATTDTKGGEAYDFGKFF